MSFIIDTDNSEFQDALRLIQFTNSSVFLTGKAGTGKSTFLKYICSHTHKKYVVVAPTGIAAINAGGMTIHSFFKAPFRPTLPDDPDLSTKDGRIFDMLKYRKQHVKLIVETELLIIDEVSMVRADLLDFIDRVLRVYTKNMHQPFGGKQVLMVGDVFQLEPVVKPDDWAILRRFYKSPYFFDARVFSQIPLVQIELKKVYRQSNSQFISLLDKIRVKKSVQADIDTINQRHIPGFNPAYNDLFITLATRRDTVDYINDKKLAELPSEQFCFEGKITGEFPESSLPTLKTLHLKENSQIMFLKNDIERRWYNGSLGMIDEISDDAIYVRLENDQIVLIEKEVWRNLRYTYNEKENRIVEEELGSFTQYPIKLAWAITVHKSQGLTFEKAIIDFSGGAFAGGQLYVALSRCRSLEGIVLKSPISIRDVIVNNEVVQFSGQANNKVLIEAQLNSAKADDCYKQAAFAFDKDQYSEAVQLFSQAVNLRNELDKPHVQRLISTKLLKINHLHNQISQLEQQAKQQQKAVAEFAREYYLMANECQVKFNDRRAAIANLDKALKLAPNMIEALMRRAHLHIESNDYTAAIDDYNAVLKLKRKNFLAFYHRGRAKLLILDYIGAYNDLLAASNLKDDHAEALFYLGNACNKLGDSDKAKIYWNMAKQLGFESE